LESEVSASFDRLQRYECRFVVGGLQSFGGDGGVVFQLRVGRDEGLLQLRGRLFRFRGPGARLARTVGLAATAQAQKQGNAQKTGQATDRFNWFSHKGHKTLRNRSPFRPERSTAGF